VCFIIALIYALSGIFMAVWRRQRRQTGRARRHEGPPVPSKSKRPGPLSGP